MKEYWQSDLKANFNQKGYVVIVSRQQAIKLAIGMARAQDTVLIAGKGHENYQIVGKERLPFDDRQEACNALAEREEDIHF